MSLINCKVCGKEISSTAEKCPHCGHSYQAKFVVQGCLTVVVVLGILWGGMVWFCSGPSTPPAATKPEFTIEEKLASLHSGEGVQSPDPRVDAFKVILDSLVLVCTEERSHIADMIYAGWKEVKEKSTLLEFGQAVAQTGPSFKKFHSMAGSNDGEGSCAEIVSGIVVIMNAK
jgi:hypothetical protein